MAPSPEPSVNAVQCCSRAFLFGDSPLCRFCSVELMHGDVDGGMLTTLQDPSCPVCHLKAAKSLGFPAGICPTAPAPASVSNGVSVSQPGPQGPCSPSKGLRGSRELVKKDHPQEQWCDWPGSCGSTGSCV